MKYSVIIPVYNAEKTLRRCLDSLAVQAFSDAEFLLIDDGSADNSAAICREYAARDSRFRLISKENGGVSTARNLGLEMARGTFILFVDSDDYVQPDYFLRLEELDGEGRYDYLLFSYNRFNGDVITERILPEFASCNEAEYAPALGWAYRAKRINSPWNKRYRSSILHEHGLRFHTALPIAEDTLFNLNYLLHIRSYRTSGAKLYNVSLENPGSLSRKPLANRQELLAIFDREAEQAITAAPISEALRDTLTRARNFLLLSDIYSEAKQLHLAQAGLPDRWRRLYALCRDFSRNYPKLPGDLRSRLLALPVRLRLAPAIDLLGKKLSK
jgi:glycosyltransferase involved in cell wall biosynthesis